MSDLISAGSSFGTYENQDKILVALSGGVDSSVCVQILKEQGFAVEGLVIEFSPAHKAAAESAEVAAKQLGIKLHKVQCYDLFEKCVIAPFCAEYADGKTPNPCVVCNPNVKFKILCDKADELGIEFVATGHYARVDTDENGVYHIQCAVSEARDQSYMLYRLPQNILKRLSLPVGEFEKPDIRQMAADLNLSCADAPDSQEICFIPDGNYPEYIENRGVKSKPGNFIAPDGKVIGPHKGVLHYTVGQRRGLNIALGKPVFVKSILENGDIKLAFGGDEYYKGFYVTDVFTCDGKALCGEYTVKIRSAAKPVPCTVANDENGIYVSFEQPVRAPAPGQSAVFYRGDLVMGGGYIDKTVE